MVAALKPLSRCVACSRVTKRPVFVFISTKLRPGDRLQVFALEDDYSFGVLQSETHWQWFLVKCSKLTERLIYTPESVFDTFPWPQFEVGSDRRADRSGNSAPGGRALPTAAIAKIAAVAAAGREVRRVRAEALTKIKGGLRAVYRTLELPGANPLKDAHAALDAAVLAAYGFAAKQDLLAQLLALNLAVAAKIEAHQPVTAPGIPSGYPDATKLVTADCIRPTSPVSP